MNAKSKALLLPEEKVRKAFEESYCIIDVIKHLQLPLHSRSSKIVQLLRDQYQIDTSHFDLKKKQRKHLRVTKLCPVCSHEFETLSGGRDAKTTCSHKCSNTFFRSGDQNGMRAAKLAGLTDGTRVECYADICWRYHQRECVVCGERLIVAVHHLNEIHDDNRPENLVPLCPTHHQYWHSRHKHLIEKTVLDYVEEWKRKNDC
jgi:hypothetical protein